MCTKTVFSISIKLLKQKVVRIGDDSLEVDDQQNGVLLKFKIVSYQKPQSIFLLLKIVKL